MSILDVKLHFVLINKPKGNADSGLTWSFPMIPVFYPAAFKLLGMFAVSASYIWYPQPILFVHFDEDINRLKMPREMENSRLVGHKHFHIKHHYLPIYPGSVF